MFKYLAKGLGFGFIEWMTMFNNPFNDKFMKDIKMNWWSSIIVESGLLCVDWYIGIRYTMNVMKVISRICSCWPRYGVTMYTVVAFPSIFALVNNFLSMIPNIWGFPTTLLICWCWGDNRRQWAHQIHEWRCWWWYRWWWARQIMCHGAGIMICWLDYELFLLGLHCQEWAIGYMWMWAVICFLLLDI